MKALIHIIYLFLSLTPASPFAPVYRSTRATASSVTALQGRKSKRKGKQAHAPREGKSVQDARFDVMTQNLMFTMVGLSKVLTDKSKTIVNGIHLSRTDGQTVFLEDLCGGPQWSGVSKH